ncbi:MAG: double-strand break repair protein AddB [Candidatus Liberibacter europaeus]|uniref:Double-strand break repair protein AddB n=1 Tax=Candidatus Liberibacter europaeus TaxID=744859 RepID=A0A2T4VYX8_9HYPH|nr:double-strand break repair protein AddB [Candidatus Liberibacter europaeus]PTL86989.1 MAG: double-strand break repair protein AddB [Candidatus Liberibacter europaeus]
MKNQKSNVFTIASYSPFFRELILSLLNGELVEGFKYNKSNPLSLASVTIYVPTKRAAQSLRSEFFDIIGNKFTILPTIKPLGDILEENYFFNADLLLSCNIDLPLSNIRRLLELSRLILLWRKHLPDKIRDIHPESPLTLSASHADAIWLAKNLASIIDIVEIEEKNWDDLYLLDNEQYGAWWFIALDFLKIASKYWKERLSELSASSNAHYQIQLIRAEAEYISLKGSKGPVIIAGSTGSIPATARLMSIIANDHNGAIVLPGLDVFMPENIWQTITKKSNIIDKSNVDYSMHPQYSLAKLLQFLKIKRKDVRCLGNINEEMRLRSIMISKAFLPSSTDAPQKTEIVNDKTADLAQSFADVALIEATNEREEATAIAIAMRMSLEKHKHTQTALITADQDLARRVKLELTRFGIDIDVSAGIPLSTTLQGSILITILNAILKSNDCMTTAILIKHPLAKFGFPEKYLLQAKNALEFIALRGNRDSYDITQIKSIVTSKIAEQKNEKHTPHWKSRLSDKDNELAILLAESIVKAITPLAEYRMDRSSCCNNLDISDWTKLTVRCLENICLDENKQLINLWTGKEGKALSSFFSNIIETKNCLITSPIEWIEIVSALISGETVKPINEKSSRLFILGTLESRLISFDTLILGGLNEGVWPKHISQNPFLSRIMQGDLGLEAAEKCIGQAAHDFEMASGTRHIIYTRSLQKNKDPTVASRWLQRLLVFGGKSFFDDLKKKGNQYLKWARGIDSTNKQTVSTRPKPFPNPATQPKTYSFSEVKQLISDPYAIYAKKILKLDPIPHFNNDPDAKYRGTFFHNVVTRLIQKKINKNTPVIINYMEKIIDECFEKEKLPPHIDVIWRPLFYKIAYSFLSHEDKKSALIKQVVVDTPARMQIESIGIQLTGIADRINILESGYADIIDYKTGSTPKKKTAQNLIDPQLALEAAALQAGAFYQLERKKVEKIIYIRLKPELEIDCITDNNHSTEELAKKSLRNLIEFVSLLQNGKQPFTSHLRLSEKSNITSEYDHLARMEEWIEDYDHDK